MPKLSPHRVLVSATAFVAVASVAQAHPGHDGHDFTWDFGHLAAYPDATILCIGVLGLVAWVTWQIVSARAEEPKPVRVRNEDPRRGR